jgi:ceramide glucosyltransferase
MLLGLSTLGLYLLLLITKAYLSLRYARIYTKEFNVQGESNESLTVMQPILSGDSLLESSLRHNLEQAPTWVYFLWLVDENDTEAQRVTEKLAKDFEGIEIVLCPNVPECVNPKSFKLDYAFDNVKTPLLAVLDDDTLLSNKSLEQARRALQGADIYTGLPYYLPGKNFWSSLVAHFVNNNSIMTYLPLLNFMEPLSLNGMFYVVRKETLARIGGFKAILHQLGDDYAMAKLVKSHNGTIVQGSEPQAIQTSVVSFSHYLKLMQRWFLFAQLQVMEQTLNVKVLLLIFLGLPSLLLWISIVSLTTSWLSIAILLLMLTLRHFILRHLQRKLFSELRSFSFFTSVLSECLQPFHMFHGTFVKRIRWRSRVIELQPNGTFSHLEDS